jgi:hypothetical protein
VLEEELLNLLLSAMEVVLSSDKLPVATEDVLYDFVIKWGRKHYPNVDERREILSNKLCHLIRFQNMSHQKLREAVSSNDLDNVCTTKAVLKALFMKAEAPHKIVNFKKRAYQQKQLTVMYFDSPHPSSLAVWNLHRDDCQLFKDRAALRFQDFIFRGSAFHIQGLCVSKIEQLCVSKISYSGALRFKDRAALRFDHSLPAMTTSINSAWLFTFLTLRGTMKIPTMTILLISTTIRHYDDINSEDEDEDSDIEEDGRIQFDFKVRSNNDHPTPFGLHLP